MRTRPQRHFSTDEYVYYKSPRMVQLDDELGDISCKISDREFSILDEVRLCCAARCEVVSIEHVHTGPGEADAVYRGHHSDVPRDSSPGLRPVACCGRHRSTLVCDVTHTSSLSLSLSLTHPRTGLSHCLSTSPCSTSKAVATRCVNYA